MTDSYIQVPPDSTGKQIATNEVGGKQYQIVNIADDTGAAVTPLTDAQLRASAVPVSISGSIPVTVASALEITNDAGNPIPVSVATIPLPSGAASDATLTALNAIQTEVRNLAQTMNILLAAIFEKMPRVTGNDQMAISIESGGISTVTSVTNVVNNGTTGTKFVSGDNINLSGMVQIYDNIKRS